MGGQFRHAVRPHRRQAGSRSSASSARTSSSAPCSQHGAKRAAMASRSAARGGSSRMAVNRHGAGVVALRLPGGEADARCRATPPRRGRCAGCRWAAAARRSPGLLPRGGHAAPPGRVPPAGAAPRPARQGRDSGMSARARRSARRNTGRLPPVRIGSRPALRAASHGGARLRAPPRDAAGFGRGATP